MSGFTKVILICCEEELPQYKYKNKQNEGVCLQSVPVSFLL